MIGYMIGALLLGAALAALAYEHFIAAPLRARLNFFQRLR